MKLHPRFLSKLLLIAAAAGLVACGGGAGGGVSVPVSTGPVTPVAASLEMSISANQLDSSGVAFATVTVTAKNASNIAVPGVVVAFAASSGNLTVVNATTDVGGQAVAKIFVGADKTNRSIAVSASANGVSASSAVAVQGTAMTVSGPTAVGLGTPVQLSATLKDSSGAGIAGVPVTLSSTLGNGANKVCVPASCATDSSGSVQFTYSPLVTGADTITISALGATGVQTVQAASSLITVSVAPDAGASSASEFAINQVGKTVTVALNAPMSSFPATVSLSSTAGTISPASIVLTGPSIASTAATLTTNSSVGSGVVLVTQTAANGAAVANGVSNSFQFEIVSRVAASVTLQASPSVIPANSAGSTSNKSTITATVRDAVGNPVKGATVNFTKPADASSGSLQSATAISNSSGLATTNYIAGPNAASGTGVSINATVAGLATAPAVMNVTVAQQALFVNMGFSNVIIIENSTTYGKEFSVSVTDAAGQPISGANINVALLPDHFYKGVMVGVKADGSSPNTAIGETAVKWGAFTPAALANGCANEDVNFSGTIQAGEDINGNGQLDPGIRPTVVQVSGGPVAGTTNATGFAMFKMSYLKQDAIWSQYRVTASSNTAQGGAQGNASQIYRLELAKADVENITSPPPNPVSLFGAGTLPANATCTNVQ